MLVDPFYVRLPVPIPDDPTEDEIQNILWSLWPPIANTSMVNLKDYTLYRP